MIGALDKFEVQLIERSKNSPLCSMPRRPRAAGFEKEPDATFGFVDPNFDQAGRGYIPMLVANLMRFAQPAGEITIVFPQLRQHVERLDVGGVIVFHALHFSDLAGRTQRRPANLADAFRHRIGHGEELVGLFVEEQVIIAEMGPAHVPMEIFCLQVDRENVGEERIYRSGNILGGARGKIRRRVERRFESSRRGRGMIGFHTMV